METERPRILVGDKIVDEAIAMLRGNADVDINIGIGQEELENVIENYDALIVRSVPLVTEAVLSRGKRLKVVGRAGNGVDNIDVEAATRHGVVVVNTPDSNSISACEQTVALMLAAARNLPQANATLKQGGWGRNQFMGNELYGKTLGIVGLGRIGSLLATRLKCFGMRVIAYDPYITPERFKRSGAERMENLDDLMRQADFITVHTPKTEETIGMIGEQQFRIAKPGVRVVNCARGGIIDEHALADALRLGTVASASLDVFSSEPCSGNPLLEFDNVVVTPHIGATTYEAQHRVGTDVATFVLAALRGEIAPNTVNLPCLMSDELDSLRPHLHLAENLGKLYYQLEKGPVERVELTYSGEVANKETEIITLSFLKGLLTPVMGENVNLVNASWLAENRGIKVFEKKETEATGYLNLITACIARNGKQISFAGTVSPDNGSRIVRINRYQMDIALTPYMLFVEHYDWPGMIGFLGTILGKANVNIATMQVGRVTRDQEAMMILSVDSPVDEAAMAQLRQLEGIRSVKAISL
jgi:D-3-phosphoglycerate dehydrogenase